MAKIIGTACPNLPWQERPANWHCPIWRDTGNPIIRHNQLKRSNSIFNSAVVPFQEGFAGVFRCDDIARHCRLHAGFSKDGIHWQIDEAPIQFESSVPFEYGYDPRVCRIEDRWYVTWCNGMNGEPTIGLAETTDFRRFRQMENAFLPYNRNGVLFPRRINGMYVMLSRPSDNGATSFGDIYLSRRGGATEDVFIRSHSGRTAEQLSAGGRIILGWFGIGEIQEKFENIFGKEAVDRRRSGGPPLEQADMVSLMRHFRAMSWRSTLRCPTSRTIAAASVPSNFPDPSGIFS